MSPVQVENMRICSRHFSPDDFESYGRQGKRKIKFDRFPIEETFNPLEQGVLCPAPSIAFSAISSTAHHSDCHSSAVSSKRLKDDADSSSRFNSTVAVAPIPFRRVGSRRRVRHSFTSTEAKQAQRIKALSSKLKILKQKNKRLEAAAKHNSKDVSFARSIKALDSSLQNFIAMQIEHSKKKPWSPVEKQFALGLFYVSPKAYVYLKDKKHFALPCVTLIRTWINELNLKPGVSTEAFDKLHIKSQTMTAQERQCVLMLDEMSIKRILEYDPKADLIEGFQDLGDLRRTRDLANHALTFMIRGLIYSWKHPICYVTSNNCVNASNLKNLVFSVIDKVRSIGFDIKAMVCDQGSPNRALIASLGVTSEKPYLERDSQKIYVMFDAPHLIKSVRNNLLMRDFVIDGETISWGVISALRNIEKGKACKAAPKLTDQHINPNAFQKMSVSLATQVFSASVSAAIHTGFMTGQLQHPASVFTANFCKRVNDIFDCLNSKRQNHPNPLSRALSESEPQVEEYLRSSILWIKNWSTKDGRKPPPCFEGLVLTISSVLQLWDDMRKSGTSFLITSRFNQDLLENLFAILRGRSGFNQRPSAMTYRRNLQYAMVANLLKPSAASNCESDDTTALYSILANRTEAEGDSKRDIKSDIDVWVGEQPLDIADGAISIEKDDDESEGVELDNVGETSIENITLETCAKKYVAGYLAYKCLQKFDCSECRCSLLKGNQNYENVDELLIFWKAYRCKEKYELGKLKVPSEQLNNVTQTMYTIFTTTFESHPHMNNLRQHLEKCIRDVIAKTHPDFLSIEGACFDHRVFLIQLFVRTHIFNKVKWISRDERDKSNTSMLNGQRKRTNLGSVKPHPKLQKVMHK